MKRLVLIDSHAVIHRAYHALPPLTSPQGKPINAVYGFASVLLKMLKDLKPDYAVAAFDHEGPTFRHLAYERYKATRAKAPEELYQQIPAVKELLAAFGIPVIEKQGYEADDLIGTIASGVGKHHPDVEVIIVTGDLDTLQLITPRIKVFTMKKGVSDTVLYDEAAVKERYGLKPKQLIDFKGLRGDPSDNIPGVKGIGEKTASELLKARGSIEEIYRALKKNKLAARPAVLEALKNHEADALFSKTLATIDRRAPVKFVLASARLRKSAAKEKIRPAFEKLGFYSLLRRMDGSAMAAAASDADSAEQALQSVSAGTEKSVRASKVKSLGAIPQGGSHAVMLADRETGRLVFMTEPGGVFELPLSALADSKISSRFTPDRPVFVFGAKDLLKLGFSYDPALVRDIWLMWWLLEPGRKSYTIETLMAKEAGRRDVMDLTGQAAAIFGLAPLLERRLREQELWGVYQELEAPLVLILYEMEKRGIGFNPKPLTVLSKKMSQELAKLEKQIHSIAGVSFNINSPRQLAEVLFEKLKLAPAGLRKTEKLGVISTRESELLKLRRRHPIIDDLLRYREIFKLKSTYVDALPQLIGADGRIRTTWNQTGTATGRLSSQEPNLQNIPIRSQEGREVRKAFVAEKGFRLAAFDYSQLELRIAADLSQDQKMSEAFEKGVDIHRLTASEVNNLPLEKVTPELRYQAKALNFGILYGMGSRAFAESAGISRGEAEHFIQEYFRDFQGIRNFVEATKEFARVHGFTKTAFGRKRYFPNITATGFRLQRESERQAVNFPIQGCLPYQARILTSEGYLPIGLVYERSPSQRPRYVWDGSQWRRYTPLNRGSAQLAELTLENGQVLKCDTRHEVLTISPEGYQWKKFTELKRGDEICISLPQELRFRLPKRIVFNFASSKTHNARSLHIKNPDAKFWYWLGYYYGDGWFSRRVIRGYERLALGYAFGHQEQEKLRECKSYFQRLGLNPLVRTFSPTSRRGHQKFGVTVESRGLGLFLTKLGVMVGKTAKTKRLLPFIYSETLENRKAFLRGLLDADGWYGRDNNDVMTLHLAQRELLQDTMLLLRTVGVPSKLRGPYGPYGKSQNVSYRLDIPRALLLSRFDDGGTRYRLRYGPKVPKFVLEAFIERYPNLPKKFFHRTSDHVEYHRWKNGGTCSVMFFAGFLKRYNLTLPSLLYDFCRLRQKRVLNQLETTYTLSVAGSHRFDSEGIISKNTAADIVKKAMIEIDRMIIARRWEGKVRMLLQVHDELIFEVKKDILEPALAGIRAIMERVWPGKIPMRVEAKQGDNWGELETA